MVDHWLDSNFKNYTTEDLLNEIYGDDPAFSTWARISAKIEIEARVIERMIEMGMPTIMQEANEMHLAKLKSRGWR
jgi:hypothetical protein